MFRIYRSLNGIVAWVKNRCVWEMSKRKCTYNNCVSTLIFWNCFENCDFSCSLWFLLLLLVVFIVVSLHAVLTQNEQFMSCVTVAFSERYLVITRPSHYQKVKSLFFLYVLHLWLTLWLRSRNMVCFIFTERICVRTWVLLYSFIYTSILITCKETKNG